jgi:hypothetical protein
MISFLNCRFCKLDFAGAAVAGETVLQNTTT